MQIDKRMLEIMKSLDKSHEVYKEGEKEVNKDLMSEENVRLKKLISNETNSDFKNENYYIAGRFGAGGKGKTVNSFLDDYVDNSNLKTPKVEPSGLKSEEALEISIKRTLKSGKPVNNIDFYDEINWHLMNLGFPTVLEDSIKNTIISMIGE